jgi:hypothetical protein
MCKILNRFTLDKTFELMWKHKLGLCLSINTVINRSAEDILKQF